MDQHVKENYFTKAIVQYLSNGETIDAKATQEASQYMLFDHSNCFGNSGDDAIKNSNVIMTGSLDHESGQTPHPLSNARICSYCRQSYVKGRNGSVFNGECIECDRACKFCATLIYTIENRFISQELKGRMLWEAYFLELPEEDFMPDNSPRWKRNSLDTSGHTFFSQNQITIMDAVGSVFNKDNVGRPAWNKTYLNGYQQWVTEFPNVNHQSVLISVAVEMGIEQIRYHPSAQLFFSPEKCYILIGEDSVMPSAEIPLPFNESINYKTTNQIDSTELTIDEIIDLIRGINFIGKCKWKEILENTGLKFSANRNESSLRKCYLKLEKRLKMINFGGKYYQVLPGFEIECIEPITSAEQANIENSSNRNLISSCTYENNERVEPPAKKIKTLRINRKQNISSDDFCHTQIRKDPNSETPDQVQKLEEKVDFDRDHTYIFNLCYPPDGNNDEFVSNGNLTFEGLESETSIRVETTPEDLNFYLIDTINNIYGDNTAGPYYLSVIRKIPTSFEEGWKYSWGGISRDVLPKNRRNIIKWNELKAMLLKLKFIEEGKRNIVIRKFN